MTRAGGPVEIRDVVDPDEPVLVRRVSAAAGALVVSIEPMLEGVVHSTGAFVDPATGLPRASTDLWEQHEGQHAY